MGFVFAKCGLIDLLGFKTRFQGSRTVQGPPSSFSLKFSSLGQWGGAEGQLQAVPLSLKPMTKGATPRLSGCTPALPRGEEPLCPPV